MKTSRRFRSGISLLEVVLALSLSVVLLGAIGVAVDQSWRLTTQGQVEMQRQQVARAVVKLLERDIRSAMFVPQETSDDTQESTSTASTATNSKSGTTSASTASSSSTINGFSSSGTVLTGTSSSQQSAMVLTSRGIRGDQFTIEIDGARPQRELAFALPVNAVIPSSRTSDLRTVMWLIAAPGQAQEALGRAGLAREEGDRYAIASAESLGKSSSGNFSATVLAPEIIAIQFRYFDGTTWLTSWDSVAMGNLPRAVEVQLQFAPAVIKRSAFPSVGVNASTQFVRVVLQVPSVDPVPEEQP